MRLVAYKGFRTSTLFQSTHPHGVRHEQRDELTRLKKVSIHAPTRGATSLQVRRRCHRWFQSTHPHGVRRFPHSEYVCLLGVSIHAPTRGATCTRQVHHPNHQCFNPRTHTGCDTPLKNAFSPITEFQSTHPHGVRPNVYDYRNK